MNVMFSKVLKSLILILMFILKIFIHYLIQFFGQHSCFQKQKLFLFLINVCYPFLIVKSNLRNLHIDICYNLFFSYLKISYMRRLWTVCISLLNVMSGIPSLDHGKYIGWQLVHMCARKEQSLLFDLYKAFDLSNGSHKSDIFIRKNLFSLMHAQHVMRYHLI